MSATKFLSFTQTVNLIKAVGDKRTVLVKGENGIGKTALFHHLKRDPAFADYIHVDPIDCTQLSDGSVWMPDIDRDAGVSRELPNERFGVSRTNQKGINGAKPALIFLDEIEKARQFIKDVLAPIVYERRVGNYHLPDGSVVFMATNLGAEGLGDSMQAHLRNRLTIVHMRKPTLEEWQAYQNGCADSSSEVMAFAEEYPQLFDSFLDYESGGKFSGKNQEHDNPFIFNPRIKQSAYASPRSLSAASLIVNAKDYMDNDTLQAALEGTIGQSAAEALAAYVRFGSENPSFDEVRKNPATAKVAESPVAQIVMAFKLANGVQDREDAAAATQYVTRLREEMQVMFVRTVANSIRVAKFATVRPFNDLMAANRIFIA